MVPKCLEEASRNWRLWYACTRRCGKGLVDFLCSLCRIRLGWWERIRVLRMGIIGLGIFGYIKFSG